VGGPTPPKRNAPVKSPARLMSRIGRKGAARCPRTLLWSCAPDFPRLLQPHVQNRATNQQPACASVA